MATPRPGGTATLAGIARSRIGYGAMQLGENEAVTTDSAVTVLRRAVELGVDHIDTAQFYGAARANELIRDALHPYPDTLALVSKVGARREDGALVAGQRPDELRAQVEQNLVTLRCEQLAVVNLRRIDSPPGLVAEGDQIVDLDDQLAALAALRDEGKIAAIGLSNVTGDQLRQALPVGIACVQNSYNLLERAAEPLLELAHANQVAWVPFFPLGSAFPGRRRVTDEPVVRSIAAELGATPAQVGLAWLLAHDPGTLLIPGTSSVGHLEDNLAAGSVVLTTEQQRALDALG